MEIENLIIYNAEILSTIPIYEGFKYFAEFVRINCAHAHNLRSMSFIYFYVFTGYNQVNEGRRVVGVIINIIVIEVNNLQPLILFSSSWLSLNAKIGGGGLVGGE